LVQIRADRAILSKKIDFKRGRYISQSEICNLQEATFLGLVNEI